MTILLKGCWLAFLNVSRRAQRWFDGWQMGLAPRDCEAVGAPWAMLHGYVQRKGPLLLPRGKIFETVLIKLCIVVEFGKINMYLRMSIMYAHYLPASTCEFCLFTNQ